MQDSYILTTGSYFYVDMVACKSISGVLSFEGAHLNFGQIQILPLALRLLPTLPTVGAFEGLGLSEIVF